jgi:hypothetical protein
MNNEVRSGRYVAPPIQSFTKDNFRDWSNSVTAGRCYCCGWPLKATVDEGCILWNCSERPLAGAKLDRAHQQEGILRAVREATRSE